MISIVIIGNGYFGNILKSKFKNDYKISFFDPRISSYNILNSQNIDWVVIATPPHTHYDIAVNIINRGINIICEKPFTINQKEAGELIQLSQKYGTKLYIDDVFIYRDEFLTLQEKVKKVKIKKIYFNWEKYGAFNDDLFSDLVYHDIYILLYLFGDSKISNLQFLGQNKDHLSFQYSFSDILISGNYNRFKKGLKKKEIILTDDKNNEIKINFSIQKNDALQEMITKVLKETKEYFQKNNTIHYKTTGIMEKLRKNISPRIAVVGAGIFGITTAWFLSKKGYNVDLYEQKDDILQCASSINQYRIHRGYHYPRSIKTALASKENEILFKKYYSESYTNAKHYYSIAKHGSKTTKEDYISFLNKLNLEHREIDLECINKEEIVLTLETQEKIYSPFLLKDICKKLLKQYNVNIILNTSPNIEELERNYDHIILSTFKNNNTFLDNYIEKQNEYNYQFYENAIFDLPDEYKEQSFIILDGDYICISPYGDTGKSIVVDVKASIHSDIKGKTLKIPAEYKDLIDSGIIENPHITNKKQITQTLQKFFHNISIEQYRGSIFTYKVILPGSNLNVDRPTEVNKIGKNIYSIFSGKVVSCVSAAEKIYELIKK